MCVFIPSFNILSGQTICASQTYMPLHQVRINSFIIYREYIDIYYMSGRDASYGPGMGGFTQDRHIRAVL